MRINSKEQLQALTQFFETRLAQSQLNRQVLNSKLSELYQKLQNCSAQQALGSNHEFLAIRRSFQLEKVRVLAEQEGNITNELNELDEQVLKLNQSQTECLVQLGELKKINAELKLVQANKNLAEQSAVKMLTRPENDQTLSALDLKQQAEQVLSLQELKQEIKLNFKQQVSNFLLQTQPGQNYLSFSFENNSNINFTVQVSFTANSFVQLQVRPDDKKQFFPKDIEQEILEFLKKRHSLKFSIKE